MSMYIQKDLKSLVTMLKNLERLLNNSINHTTKENLSYPTASKRYNELLSKLTDLARKNSKFQAVMEFYAAVEVADYLISGNYQPAVSLQNNVRLLIADLSAIGEDEIEELDDKLPLLKYSFIESNLQAMIDACIAATSPISVVMIDIDHFRDFNTKYGHQVADDVLKAVAKRIREVVGTKGKAIRFGGEEICVILPNFNGQEAESSAKRIRTAIENYSFQSDGDTAQITVSLGVSTTTCKTDHKTLVNEADAALRQSKENGRNRVTVFSADVCTKQERRT